MRASAHPDRSDGPLRRGLVVVWALLLALVGAPCAGMADQEATCGHCAVDVSDQGGHGGSDHGGDCFHCDAEVLAAATKLDDRGSATAFPIADAPAAPFLVAARPAAPTVTAATAVPRSPDRRLYLETRRLRL